MLPSLLSYTFTTILLLSSSSIRLLGMVTDFSLHLVNSRHTIRIISMLLFQKSPCVNVSCKAYNYFFQAEEALKYATISPEPKADEDLSSSAKHPPSSVDIASLNSTDYEDEDIDLEEEERKREARIEELAKKIMNERKKLAAIEADEEQQRKRKDELDTLSERSDEEGEEGQKGE